MKFIAAIIFISFSAFAQIPKLTDVVSSLKDMSKPVMEACKDDKSKIKSCESYTDMTLLKVCLLQNKDKLSDKCKASLKLK